MSNPFLRLLFYLPVVKFELRVETSTSVLEGIRQLREFLPRYEEFLQGPFCAYLAICSLLSPLIPSVKIRSVLAERVWFFRFGVETRFHKTPQILLVEPLAIVQHISASVFYALH